MEIYVVGKQWMWKVQHIDGQREINELHVPVGRPVKLIDELGGRASTASSFPAFRVKADVVPGRYNTIWFTATKPGEYHLFCAEYCGTKHSGMIGWVIVDGAGRLPGVARAAAAGDGIAGRSAGEKLFQDLACITCHRGDGAGPRARRSTGVFGTTVAAAGRRHGRSSTRPTSASRS